MSDDRWQTFIDHEIRKALADSGADLPGAGKPLDLRHNPYVPDDQRAAFKIMADNDVAPDWVMLSKDLLARERRLRIEIDRAVGAYRQTLAAAERAAPGKKAALQENAHRLWTASRRSLEALVRQYNDQIQSYNLKVPPSVPQRPHFNLERELGQFQDLPGH
jgi:hypothetical protein